MARSKSKLRQQYEKERRRIQNQIRRMERRGYLVPEILPDIPKRITLASVRRLQKITTPTLYAKSEYVDQTTGEILTGRAGRNLERKLTAERAKRTRRDKRIREKALAAPVRFTTQVLQEFVRQMTSIFAANPTLLVHIKTWLETAIRRYGEEDVAEALFDANEQGLWPTFESISDEERLNLKLSAILDLLAPSEGAKADFLEELERLEVWGEQPS